MGDSNKEVRYEVTADPTGFVAGMERAASAATSSSDAIKAQFDKVGAAFDAVQSKLLVIAAVVAGGKFFKDAIDSTNRLTGETMNLAKRLGVTGEQASALNTALGDIYSDSDTYISAFDKFAKQLKNNESGLQAMGLQTRDANGHLRDSNELFMDALQTVGNYKPGLDQTTAAMTLFGKGVDDVMKLQKLNNGVIEDARAKNEALGLTITREGVQASKAYKAAMNDVGDVMLAVKNTIGQAVMPVFTALGEYFASTGPYVLAVFKGALTGLMLVFRSLQAVVKAVFGSIFETINHAVDQFGNLGELLDKIFSGDFKGAADVVDRIGARWKQGWSNVWENTREAFGDASSELAGDMQRVWGKGTAVDKPQGGNKTMGDYGATNGNKKPESQMGKWEAELAEDKLAYAEKQSAAGTFYQYGREAEAQFWRDKHALTVQGTADFVATRRKAAEMELQINKERFAAEVATLQAEAAQWKTNASLRLDVLAREAELVRQRYGTDSKEFQEAQKRIVEARRQAMDEVARLTEIAMQRTQQAALADVQRQEQLAQFQVQQGIMDNATLLRMQEQFEQQRFDIQRAGLLQRQSLKTQQEDPVAYAQLNAQIEQLEQQHQGRMTQIALQQETERQQLSRQAIGSMQSGWANLLQQFAQGQMRISTLIKGIFQVAMQSVVQAFAQMAAKFMAQKVAMLIFGKSVAAGELATETAKAGAGGVASMAAAPYPLNLSAPAFGAAMAEAAAGFSALMASPGFAVGSWNVPQDMIAKVHKGETIVPEQFARPMREQAEGGGFAGGGRQVNVQLNAAPLRDNFFLMHRDDLASALRQMHRDGARLAF